MSIYKKIFTYLQELFPDAKTELHYTTEFQLLVAVMLSAQTTDTQVNKTTAKLFQIVRKPEDLVALGLENFTQIIASVNLYKTKGRHIFTTAEMLIKNKGKIPNTIEELMILPGIGEKTAKVILHILYKQGVIAVDTHVHRVANRLGIVTTNTPLQTSKLLEKKIPNNYKDIAHDTIVLFGRYQCTARKPKCEECKLQQICKRYIHTK